MKTLSIRIKKEDLKNLKEYANMNNINISTLVRNLILDKLYDEIDEKKEKRILKLWNKSKTEKQYNAKDVFKELGL